jgi:hypothetical protein
MKRKPGMKQNAGESSVAGIVDLALRGSSDNQVVIGPLVWQPSDGAASKVWYFVMSTSEPGRGWRCDQIRIPPGCEGERELYRSKLLIEFARKPGTVIHDVGDEVYAARLCEALWPGERISRVRKQIEADYAGR